MNYIVKIKAIENLTHDVKRFQCEKPADYAYIPGQATAVFINKKGWEEERRPFTFTAPNDAPHLEFTVKIYSDHPGVTNELNSLKPGDELIVQDVWAPSNTKDPAILLRAAPVSRRSLPSFASLKKTAG